MGLGRRLFLQRGELGLRFLPGFNTEFRVDFVAQAAFLKNAVVSGVDIVQGAVRLEGVVSFLCRFEDFVHCAGSFGPAGVLCFGSAVSAVFGKGIRSDLFAAFPVSDLALTVSVHGGELVAVLPQDPFQPVQGRPGFQPVVFIRRIPLQQPLAVGELHLRLVLPRTGDAVHDVHFKGDIVYLEIGVGYVAHGVLGVAGQVFLKGVIQVLIHLVGFQLPAAGFVRGFRGGETQRQHHRQDAQHPTGGFSDSHAIAPFVVRVI